MYEPTAPNLKVEGSSPGVGNLTIKKILSELGINSNNLYAYMFDS
jgi:hypothetical protein